MKIFYNQSYLIIHILSDLCLDCIRPAYAVLKDIAYVVWY